MSQIRMRMSSTLMCRIYSFTDKPGQPVGPLKAEEVRADHIKVAWKKPKDNGGSEITGYVVEKMDMDSGQWIPAGEVFMRVNGCSYIYRNLYYWKLTCV